MKKGYSVINDILKGDNFIIVSNNKIDNVVINSGIYTFRKSYIEPNDVGIWKIKKLN